MKERYETPSVELELYDEVDVLTTSTEGGLEDGDTSGQIWINTFTGSAMLSVFCLCDNFSAKQIL